MAIAEELQVVIDAKVRDAVRDLKGFDSQMKKTEKSTGDVAKAMLKKAAAAGAAMVSVRALISLAKESVQLYGRQIQAENRLAAAIESTGGEVGKLLPQFKDLASEIQDLTTVGDEAALEMIQLATTMGVTEDKMEDVTKGAIGLSKAFGIGTEQAVRGVALAMQGNFDALQRYIPAIRTATSEADKMEAVQKAMADGFKVAEAEAQSAFGALEQYNNAVGDLKEELGRVIVEGAEPFIRALTGFASRTVEAIGRTREFRDILDSLGDDGVEAITSLDQAERALTGVKQKQATVYGSSILQSIELFNTQQQLEDQVERLTRREAERNKILAQYSEQSAEYVIWAENKKRADAANESALKTLQERQNERLSTDERQLKETRNQINALLELEKELASLGQEYSDVTALIRDFAAERNNLVASIKAEDIALRGSQAIQYYLDRTEAAESWLEREERILGLEVELAEAAFKRKEALHKEHLDRMRQMEDAYFTTTAQVWGSISQIVSNSYAAQIASAGDNQEKREELMKEQAAVAKRMAIFEALINTAAAITAALRVPVVGFKLAALAGAAGAAQVAAIASTPKPFRTGGIINEPVVGTGQRTGQTYTLGESGPEMVSPTAEGGGQSSMGGDVYFDGEKVGKWIQKKANSGQILIPKRAVV